MNKFQHTGVTLLLMGSLLSLISTLTPAAIGYHYLVRWCICVGLLITLTEWKDLNRLEVTGLSITLVIYNPVMPIQLGNAIAWISIALAILFYSAFKLLTKKMRIDKQSEK